MKNLKIKTIKIKKSAVVTEFLSNLKRIGSPDWAIYANQDGEVEARHNTAPLEGWTEVTDFYNGWENLDNDEETADWLSGDAFAWSEMEYTMEEEMANNDQEFSVKFI